MSAPRRCLPPFFRRVAWANLLVVALAFVYTTLDIDAGSLPGPAILLPLALEVGNLGLLAVDSRWRRAAAVAAVEPPAPPRWTVRVPDPAPDQCPVCGLDDLMWWREVDVFTLREGEERHVQPYGPYQGAHRFCAELVPYVAPPFAYLSERSGPGFVTISARDPLPIGRYAIELADGSEHNIEIIRSAELHGGWTAILGTPLCCEAKAGAPLRKR